VISSGHHAIAIGYRFLMAVPVDSFLLFTFQKKNLFFIHLQFPIKAVATVQQLRLSFFKSMQLCRALFTFSMQSSRAVGWGASPWQHGRK
jgi:hypothetical protein